MLKEMKRTSVKRIYVRQGLDHKNQDLFVRILLGGTTGMRIQNFPGTLKVKRHSRTVDLGSNGCQRVRTPWTVP
jgi:hypothetical protein